MRQPPNLPAHLPPPRRIEQKRYQIAREKTLHRRIAALHPQLRRTRSRMLGVPLTLRARVLTGRWPAAERGC